MSKSADKLSIRINNHYYISFRDWNALNHQSKEVLEYTYNKERKKKSMISYEEQFNLFLKRYFIWLSAVARKWLMDNGPHFQYFPSYSNLQEIHKPVRINRVFLNYFEPLHHDHLLI